MAEHVIMDAEGMKRTFLRLAHEVVERDPPEDIVLVGIRRGGEYVARRMRKYLAEAAGVEVPCGGVDIGMERDDLVSAFFLPEYTGSAPIFPSRERRSSSATTSCIRVGRFAPPSRRCSGWGGRARYGFWNSSTAAAENCPSGRISWVKTCLPPAANT